MNGPKKDMAGGAYARQALLPEGFRDQLAPYAEQEAALVRTLVDTYVSHGYDRVNPPLVEYEDSLLVGAGKTRAKQMFRLMDVDTQRMMAIRADMTMQMSRLAATRLSDAPRPLRLAYTGNVLRTKGSQLRPDRQFIQAGVELVGSQSLEAELEVIAVAVESLQAVGIENISVDLTLAPLVGHMCDQAKLTGDVRETVLEAMEAKDAGALAILDEETRAVFTRVLQATGPADRAMEMLRTMELKGASGKLIARLGRLVDMIGERLPDVTVTVDPCECHGFEYKTGIGFALFAKGAQGELGRGGRYMVTHPDGHEEEATGFSVYLDTLMRTLPMPDAPKKLYVPHGTSAAVAALYRKDGWRTIQGLAGTADAEKEARLLGCGHILLDDTVRAV
ncbi:ATP phosphoribosyltransferase regulatory subunit [Kordiimonas marina]|uniref:ATP phosphoribosyltransferase regulatory subunit n=1 Tax=Kordiimonas marina TaxID=2872312 RepID=UPI001FF32AB2|nr:ATP phosphoribosyltransferase regulatory subunit [Kordiimonas marina]MCJ9427597.1 ATP phosphoribosyltransferase regulatory subunit [Kordiimonas marina]